MGYLSPVHTGDKVDRIGNEVDRDKLSNKGPFIATQLNSTRRRVELSCVGEVSITTPTQLNSSQLNSTDLLRADWLYASTGSVALPIVELSCVAINGP